MLTPVKKLGIAAVVAAMITLTGCGTPAPAPTVTITETVTLTPAPAPTITVTAEAAPPATAAPDTNATLDLTTDAGICAADAEMTNLELNNALAPLLGLPTEGYARTYAQDDAIREYKNAAFLRECPERAG